MKKLRACAAGAFVTFVTTFAACSSAPSQPPIDTSGSTTGDQGGGGPVPGDAGPAVDEGTTATPSDDAGIPDSATDTSSNCLLGTCAGCCTPTGQCEPGSTNAQCGSNGVACQQCTGSQNCTTTIGCQ
jgi:hypothetical protein